MSLYGGAAGKEVLTLCEVEVYEHETPRRLKGASAAGALTAAARRFVEAYHQAVAGPRQGRRQLLLRRAAELLGEALDAVSDDDAAGLLRLYEEASDLPIPAAEPPKSAASIASASPPVLLVRARALKRLALSEACRKAPSNCCPPAASRSAAGCLATALALAKLAGSAGSGLARSLFDLAVEGYDGALQPFVFWPSFRESCEVYFPDLTLGSARLGPFWDPLDPALQPLGELLGSSIATAALHADLEVLSKRRGQPAFEPAYASLVEEGAWERVVLYDGVRGWDPRWCGGTGTARLQLCELLRGRLLGEAARLLRYYVLDNNEEVSISRLSGPRTVVRPHNGGTNARINFDLLVEGHGKTSLRIGGDSKVFGAGRAAAREHLVIFDACHDREVVYEGDAPLFFLEVGIMHPALAAEAAAKPARDEL